MENHVVCNKLWLLVLIFILKSISRLFEQDQLVHVLCCFLKAFLFKPMCKLD